MNDTIKQQWGFSTKDIFSTSIRLATELEVVNKQWFEKYKKDLKKLNKNWLN